MAGDTSGSTQPRRLSSGLPVCRIETAAQFKAMSSPIRNQIIGIVESLTADDSATGETRGVSVREIAKQMGRSASALYSHLEMMVDAGLLVEVGTQRSGGRDATTYAVPGELIELVMPTEEGPELDALCEYIRSVARNAGQEAVLAAIDRALGRREIGPHDTGGATLRGWLDPDQRTELRQLMARINDLFVDRPRRPGTRYMAATFMFRPCRLPGGEIADEPAQDPDAQSTG